MFPSCRRRLNGGRQTRLVKVATRILGRIRSTRQPLANAKLKAVCARGGSEKKPITATIRTLDCACVAWLDFETSITL